MCELISEKSTVKIATHVGLVLNLVRKPFISHFMLIFSLTVSFPAELYMGIEKDDLNYTLFYWRSLL